MVTTAQRDQRRAAGKRSGQVRGHREGSGESDGNPDAPMPVTADPDVDAQMAAYIAVAGKPKYWTDIKACEQVRAEIYKTRAAALADKIARGGLLTKEQVRARDERGAKAYKDGLLKVQELLTAHVPADRLLDAQKAAREWIETTLNQVAAEIEGAK